MRIRPSVCLDALPAGGSYVDRFRLAAAIGFEGVEVDCGLGEAEAIRDAAALAGLVVHSVSTPANWTHPLSSGNPADLATGIRATLGAIETAHALGADTVLLVPAMVDRTTSYAQAYARSQAVIRAEILPAARQLGIALGIENVWNGMLLGPLEYVRYIDEFESPWVRAYLDLGNMVFGHSEDWIDIAGARTIKLHLKDFRLAMRPGRFRWERIGNGQVDWTRVRAALERTGFSGWGTCAGAARAQGLMTELVYRAAAKAPPRLLSAFPGSRKALHAAQGYCGRRMLTDVMSRFRHHLA